MRNRSITLTLMGDPIAKARARLRTGFKRRFYDCQHLEKLKLQMILQAQFGSTEPFEGPVDLNVTFYMPIKKSHFVPENSIHYYRPDADNLLKWVMDLANGICYRDDCICATITAQKLYSIKPRTVITIKELEYVKKEKRPKQLV